MAIKFSILYPEGFPAVGRDYPSKVNEFSGLYRPDVRLVVEDNTQERIVDVKPAIVPDETQLLEFVHEKIDPGTRRADHFRQDLL